MLRQKKVMENNQVHGIKPIGGGKREVVIASPVQVH